MIHIVVTLAELQPPSMFKKCEMVICLHMAVVYMQSVGSIHL